MELSSNILKDLHQERDATIARLQQDFEGLISLFAECESVLEQSLLFSLFQQTASYFCRHHKPHIMAQCFGEPDWNGFTLRILPQYSLAVASCEKASALQKKARYRADILLLLYPPWNPQRELQAKDILGSACTRLVIEVDGHDFHERTKEQAQRDKKRDRDLQAAGFTVFRFTGREVYSGADDKALEIISYLNGQCVEYARRARLRFYEDAELD